MPYNLETVEDLTSPGKVFSYRQTIEDKARPAIVDTHREFLKQARSLTRDEGMHLREGQLEDLWSKVVADRVPHTRMKKEMRPRVKLHLLNLSLPETVYETAHDLLSNSEDEHWSQAELHDAIDAQLGFYDADDLQASLLDKLTKRSGKWSSWAAGVAVGVGTSLAGASIAYMLKGEKDTNRFWVTRRDAKVRDTHMAADGQKRGIREDFVVGGEKLKWPGDDRGSPANIKNCRCVVTYSTQSLKDILKSKLQTMMFTPTEEDQSEEEIEKELRS